ncbi:MAG: glycosyltransferase family 2 protein [Bacteroidia bacterium]|nr:glycosyltransferase family 2 protein [Bacteroidia bacterium]MCF8426250.1 glycosyltransferase family 2 protein [Bacteroidia bacterium]MCF8445455.1 glycosyltransferase family 2 protein [Bacteroidia bacterium]
MQNSENKPIELSVVMPCLNEAETIEVCIRKAFGWMENNGVSGEVVIGDNGSTDGSQKMAEALGARVIAVPRKGYGSALMGAIDASKGKYVIMADSDDSYDFSNLSPFIEELRKGRDLVMGNRFKGGIQPGAMPPLHRYLGNPVLSFIGRLFFNCPVGDFHCGLRGFRQDIVSLLDLKTTGMEFASEMVVKATIFKLDITEVPTTLSKDGRTRPPHLRTWRDGWRHLRFLLIYSPRWLFLYPGLFLMLVGLILSLMIIQGPLGMFNHIYFDTNTLLYAGAFVIVGYQAVSFGIFTRAYAVQAGFLPAKDSLTKAFDLVTLEVGLIIGILILFAGIGGTFYSLFLWEQSDFGQLEYSKILRIVIPSVVSLIIGLQTILSSFLLSVLSVNKK